jgi:uncharacterized protein
MVDQEVKNWWENGIRFECQGSGRCCVSHGSYGYVYLTKEDRIRLAHAKRLSTMAFTKKYCVQTDGVYHLKDGDGGQCIFLNEKRCGVYEGRPTQCRTWPFWPEVMSAKIWNKEVASFCPGVGKGRLWTSKEIKSNLEQQRLSEENYGS